MMNDIQLANEIRRRKIVAMVITIAIILLLTVGIAFRILYRECMYRVGIDRIEQADYSGAAQAFMRAGLRYKETSRYICTVAELSKSIPFSDYSLDDRLIDSLNNDFEEKLIFGINDDGSINGKLYGSYTTDGEYLRVMLAGEKEHIVDGFVVFLRHVYGIDSSEVESNISSAVYHEQESETRHSFYISQSTDHMVSIWMKSGYTVMTCEIASRKEQLQILQPESSICVPTPEPTAIPGNQASTSLPEISYKELSVNVSGKIVSSSVIESIHPEYVRDSDYGLYIDGKLVAAVPKQDGLYYISGYEEYDGYDDSRRFSNLEDYGEYEWETKDYTTWNQAIVTDSPVWNGNKVLIACYYNVPSFQEGETAVSDWYYTLVSAGYGDRWSGPFRLSDINQFNLPSGHIVQGFVFRDTVGINDNYFKIHELYLELFVGGTSRALCEFDLIIPDDGAMTGYIPEDEVWRIILPYIPVPVCD